MGAIYGMGDLQNRKTEEFSDVVTPVQSGSSDVKSSLGTVLA